MMTIEVRINGCLIGHAYIVNQGMSKTGQCCYSYEYYHVGKATEVKSAKGALKSGKIEHKREQGAEALAMKVLGEVIGKG